MIWRDICMVQLQPVKNTPLVKDIEQQATMKKLSLSLWKHKQDNFWKNFYKKTLCTLLGWLIILDMTELFKYQVFHLLNLVLLHVLCKAKVTLDNNQSPNSI